MISKDLTRMWNPHSNTAGVSACNCLNDGRADDVEAFLKANTNPEFAQHGTFDGEPYYAPAIGSNDISYLYANPEKIDGWADGLIPEGAEGRDHHDLSQAGYSVTDLDLNSMVSGDYSGNVGWNEDYFILLSRPVAELHLKWWEAELDRIHKEYPDLLEEMDGTPEQHEDGANDVPPQVLPYVGQSTETR